MSDMELDIKRLIFDNLPDSDDDVNIIVNRRITRNRLIIAVSNVLADINRKYEVVLKEVVEEE